MIIIITATITTTIIVINIIIIIIIITTISTGAVPRLQRAVEAASGPELPYDMI